jgi:hypothetical protein
MATELYTGPLRQNQGMRYNFSVYPLKTTDAAGCLVKGYAHLPDAFKFARDLAKAEGKPLRMFLDDGCDPVIVPPF